MKPEKNEEEDSVLELIHSERKFSNIDINRLPIEKYYQLHQ